MAKRVKRLRHAIAQALTFVGFEGELTVDTTNKSVRVHDATTPGGFETARADLINAVSADNVTDGKMTKSLVQNLEGVISESAQNVVNIAQEIVDRVADVDAEEARALLGEATLQTNIDNEATARNAADANLQTNIDAETASRIAGDNTLQTNINNEATSRANADTTLQNNIDANTSAISSKISTTDYATSAVGGTVKMRITGTSLYIRTDGVNA